MPDKTEIRPVPVTAKEMAPGLQPTLSRMHQAMNDMFNELFNGFGLHRGQSPEAMWAPAVNLYQQDGSLIADCAMPGVKKDDIKISVTSDMLTIEADYKRTESKKSDKVYYSEMESGSFYRQLALPVAVKASEVKATMDHGMLKVTMPTVKPAEAKVTVPVS